MTVSTIYVPRVYVATAGQTVFPYEWLILDSSHMTITVNNVAKTIGVDCTVSDAGVDGGGNVTFLSGLEVGDVVVLTRSTPRTQAVDLGAGLTFYEDTLEAMCDKLTLIAQEAPASASSKSLQAGWSYGTAPPTTGIHFVGEVILNAAPVAGENMGWVCVEYGAPGTWKAWGGISL